MKHDNFRELLADYPYDENQVKDCLLGVELLETSLAEAASPKTLETAIADDIPAFASDLIARNLNERTRFVGIYFYANMIGNYSLMVGVLELLDGFEIMGNLHRAIGEELGIETQAALFKGIDLPAIGTMPVEWMRANAVLFPRLQDAATPEMVKNILTSGLRNLPDEHYLPIKKRYEESADIDSFLEDRGKRHLDNLKKQQDDGTPYFNQFIDDSVIGFVQNTPEIGQGVRQGNTIIEIKIPHQSIEYLATSDIAAKQYHVCHCPLVKESIGNEEFTIAPAFCDFCPSFNAKPWEVIFGQKLQYEVLESALRGDVWCKFAIHLPQAAAEVP
jgi:hypothetical protein